MTRPKFTTKRGFLTFYAFACGYLETNQDWADVRKVCLSLINSELRLFELVVYDHEERVRRREHIIGLLPARAWFVQACKEVGCQRRRNKP